MGWRRERRGRSPPVRQICRANLDRAAAPEGRAPVPGRESIPGLEALRTPRSPVGAFLLGAGGGTGVDETHGFDKYAEQIWTAQRPRKGERPYPGASQSLAKKPAQKGHWIQFPGCWRRRDRSGNCSPFRAQGSAAGPGTPGPAPLTLIKKQPLRTFFCESLSGARDRSCRDGAR